MDQFQQFGLHVRAFSSGFSEMEVDRDTADRSTRGGSKKEPFRFGLFEAEISVCGTFHQKTQSPELTRTIKKYQAVPKTNIYKHVIIHAGNAALTIFFWAFTE